jgi:hypothetical protein
MSMLHGKSVDRLISTWRGPAVAFGLGVALACLALVASAAAQPATPYPAMAPLADYLMADRAAEIALARSAAPPSVSADAEVLVLGPHGYVSAGPGKNGFVCIVSRAWFSGFKDDGFWNPKQRGPICFNRQAARSVLPTFLARTTWALAGVSRPEMLKRTRDAVAAGKIRAPETGSMTYMMSKGGYLGDEAGGPWHPHIMFYTPPMPTADWGANLPGTRVFATGADGGDPYATFYIPVAAWSDGTPDEKAGAKHEM